ncbi:MAG: hypothetical protein HYR85_01750 [Planctomycetes bacterium]|nr:hypothetical protein [Planctomycetota bacterium]MBI3845992.1 hypothetical protein [Planctomycetota bacterium]
MRGIGRETSHELPGRSTTNTRVKIVPSRAPQPMASAAGNVDGLLASGRLVRVRP